MTVNLSPYAVPTYRKLGFKDTGSEQVVKRNHFNWIWLRFWMEMGDQFLFRPSIKRS